MARATNLTIEIIQDLKRVIKNLIDVDSVFVYDAKDLAESPSIGIATGPEKPVIAVLYGGMVPKAGAAKTSHQVGGSSRFVVIFCFGKKQARIKGIAEPLMDFETLKTIRTHIVQLVAPNGQPYRFVSETPDSFENFGDGYAQVFDVNCNIED